MKYPARTGIRAFAAGVLAIVAAACTQPRGPNIESDAAALAPPPQGLARIYFYRSGTPLMAMVEPAVIVNGRKVGELAPGEVFYRNARPGQYKVWLDTDAEAPVAFRLEAGARRFVRVEPDWAGLGWELTASLAGRAEAEADMRGLSVTGQPAARPWRD
jgi:hypothetical protein